MITMPLMYFLSCSEVTASDMHMHAAVLCGKEGELLSMIQMQANSPNQAVQLQ